MFNKQIEHHIESYLIEWRMMASEEEANHRTDHYPDAENTKCLKRKWQTIKLKNPKTYTKCLNGKQSNN